ncbi:MAG: response regulator transcription factor [Myxococcaceae bacterium]|nr:response regulator transcription factor [Myxococcaceae bacterium]
MDKVHVTVVEDDPIFRDAVTEVLSDEGFAITATDSAGEAIKLAKENRLGAVVLFDLDLDGRAEFATIEAVKKLQPRVPIVALTAHVADDWVFPALEAGCSGYVVKLEAIEQLGRVVREVLNGGSPLSAMVGKRVLERLYPTAAKTDVPKEELSERELAVIRELAEGYTYEQISLRLELSIGTVRSYVLRAYRKLGVRSKSEAAAAAVRMKLF